MHRIDNFLHTLDGFSKAETLQLILTFIRLSMKEASDNRKYDYNLWISIFEERNRREDFNRSELYDFARAMVDKITSDFYFDAL